MKIFVVDECNITWNQQVDFYIYGGIVIGEDNMNAMVTGLMEIKRKAGIDNERPIKWTNNKWEKEPPLDIDLHKNVKEQVLELVANSGCKIIVCLSPQRFYHVTKFNKKTGEPYQAIDKTVQSRTQRYAITDALAEFNYMLRRESETGMVFADEFNQTTKTDLTEHCLDLFRRSAFNRIIHPLVQLKNEDSYLNQINDVVLGAIYYSLSEMGHNCLPVIAQNFWGISEDPRTTLRRGFIVLPLIPRYEWCRSAKKRIQDKFLRLIGV